MRALIVVVSLKRNQCEQLFGANGTSQLFVKLVVVAASILVENHQYNLHSEFTENPVLGVGNFVNQGKGI